jgi:hypothetical protein
MIMNEAAFAAEIRARFPEGLTGVFAIGGTRTTYILEHNRQQIEDPGKITDFSAHGEYLLDRYLQFADMFYSLGGQNMIITAFSFRGFYNRGQEYGLLVTQEMQRFTNETAQAFYREHNIDPYFVGIDTLLHLPEGTPMHELGEHLTNFQKQWPYQEGRCKLLWEITSIPLYSFWHTFQAMNDDERAALDAEITSVENLEEVNRILYRRFSRAAYGTDVPMPQFYLGTNKSGDLKWRSPMPLALSGGDYLRMFYTPYPTLFTTRETLKAILEELAFKDRFYSAKTDYSGQYTPELIQSEYDRVMALSATQENVLGFARRVAKPT